MSEFKMPYIPDDKVSPLRPDLKWMWISLSILLALTIFSYIFFTLFSHFIISKLDLENEKKYFWNTFINNETKKLDISNMNYDITIPKYIDVYVTENDEVNAFATIWWNIIFTSWILKEFKYEEEFLFVLWHESEHIKNRDVIKSFSTQIPFYITLSFLWMDLGFDYSKIINLTTSYMSRETELKSDRWGIKFVKDNWWNSDCVLNFFVDKDNLFEKYLFFSSTHPTSKDRIKQIKSYSKWDNNDFSKCKLMKYDVK